MKKFVPAGSVNNQAPRSRRLYQLDSLLQHELGGLFAKLVEPPAGTLVSISAITVAADLANAQVNLSILPFARREEVVQAIKGQLREVQQELHRRLRLYRVPKLDWVIDETAERADRLEQLLDSLPKP